jgi:superfamily II DNA or RNA helicase
MSDTVLIRRGSGLLELSRDGRRPIADHLAVIVADHLQFTKRVTVEGRDAFDEDGVYRPMRFETECLYAVDASGRIVCPAGHLEPLVRCLADAGARVLYKREDPIPEMLTVTNDAALNAITFRPTQRDLVDLVSDRIRRGLPSLVQAPVGYGKSFTIQAWCARFHKARIGISVPSIANAGDMVRHLITTLSNVGQIGGGKHQTGHRVTVVTKDSLHLVEELDLLILDEVHTYAADRAFAEVLRLAERAVVVGVSATPFGRGDGADLRVESMCGSLVYEMPYARALELGLVVPIRVIWHDVPCESNPAEGYTLRSARARHGLWRNDERNRVIADVARSYPENEQVLILVQSVEHALHLKALLPEFELAYALTDELRFDKLRLIKTLKDVDFGPIRDRDRLALQRRFEDGRLLKAIATDVWAQGVSFDALSALIRADARSNQIKDTQIPGRVSRVHTGSGKYEGVLHDFLDKFDRGFAAAAQARRRNYKAHGWSESLPDSPDRKRRPRPRSTSFD